MSFDKELFDGKSFSSLLEDIYKNSRKKEIQINTLISELKPLIQNIGDATIIVPLIKEYLDVAVKNDEHLVKLAGVIQRIIAKSTSSDEESFLLSDAEKEDLINALQEDVNDLQKRNDEVEILKNKSKDILGN